MSKATDSKAQHCPLCGAGNHCAVAQGLDPAGCWCMKASIDPAALQALPAGERGRRCLCPDCAAGQHREQQELKATDVMADNAGESL